MRIQLALLLLGIGCSSNTTPMEPPSDPAATTPVVSDRGGPQPVGCPFGFGPTWAMEPPTAVLLPPHAGRTDGMSVVTVIAHTTTTDGEPTIVYQSGIADCAAATAPHSIAMDYTGTDTDGESWSGVIPAFHAGTQVCWKIAAHACGVPTTLPAAGAADFDYTTK